LFFSFRTNLYFTMLTNIKSYETLNALPYYHPKAKILVFDPQIR